jgi:cell division protein FtsQ
MNMRKPTRSARSAAQAAAQAPLALERLALALAGLAVAIALGAALFWVAQRPRFDLRRIEVTGDLRHVSRAAIRSAIAGHLRGNFFTVRLGEARAAFETIPWVAQASVRRVWPDRLVVHVVERRAVGVWGDGMVLSDTGTLFDANPAEAELDGPQVEFYGPPRFAAEAVRKLQRFAPALDAVHVALAAIEISERGSWSIRTGAGQRFDLGRDNPPGTVEARLAAVAAHYPAVVAHLGAAPVRIDARYDNGFAATAP